jgi:hypothetical protein
MGFFDLFRKSKPEPFLGLTSVDLGDDFEDLAARVQSHFASQNFLIKDPSGSLFCLSPVLVVQNGRVGQPKTMVASPFVRRFLRPEGVDIIRNRELAPTVARLAALLVVKGADLNVVDESARKMLAQVNYGYQRADSTILPFAIGDVRARLVSLIVTDVVRKLTSDYSEEKIAKGYADPSVGAGDDAIISGRDLLDEMAALKKP